MILETQLEHKLAKVQISLVQSGFRRLCSTGLTRSSQPLTGAMIMFISFRLFFSSLPNVLS
jgi:hypothetical protein